MYPNSTPEFRFFKGLDGFMVFQIRYVCPSQGYTSKWSNVPIVVEEEKTEEKISD